MVACGPTADRCPRCVAWQHGKETQERGVSALNREGNAQAEEATRELGRQLGEGSNRTTQGAQSPPEKNRGGSPHESCDDHADERAQEEGPDGRCPKFPRALVQNAHRMTAKRRLSLQREAEVVAALLEADVFFASGGMPRLRPARPTCGSATSDRWPLKVATS